MNFTVWLWCAAATEQARFDLANPPSDPPEPHYARYGATDA